MQCDLKANKALIGNVSTLADLLDYQNGAVVSRAIVDRDVGTITIFSFDEGEGLSEHTAPFDALVYGIEGEAEITISGKANTISAGQMIIMPADNPHSLRALTRFKMMLVMIRSNTT